MHPQNGSGWVRKVLLMALLGVGAILLAGPIALVLGLALVGYLAYGVGRLILRGSPVDFQSVAARAADFSRKLLGGVGWVGGRVAGAFGLLAGLAARLVRGVFGLGTLAIRLGVSSAFGGLLGAAVWSLFSFDAATLVAGGVFGAIVGAVAGLPGRRSNKVVAVNQP